MFAAIFYKNYLNALKSLKVWSLLGWLDIYKRYRRSKLGQIWIVISTLVLVGSISFIFSTLFKSNYFFFLVYVVNNLCLWVFFREIVEDSSLIFIENKFFLFNEKWNHLIMIFRLIARNAIIYMHNLILIIPINIIFNDNFTLLGLAQYILNFFIILPFFINISLIIAIVSTRFRDFRIIINNLMQLIFFLTPVIYQKINFEKYNWLFELNIFAFLLEFVNNPINNIDVTFANYVTVVIILAITTFISSIIYANKYKRINYWL